MGRLFWASLTKQQSTKLFCSHRIDLPLFSWIKLSRSTWKHSCYFVEPILLSLNLSWTHFNVVCSPFVAAWIVQTYTRFVTVWRIRSFCLFLILNVLKFHQAIIFKQCNDILNSKYLELMGTRLSEAERKYRKNDQNTANTMKNEILTQLQSNYNFCNLISKRVSVLYWVRILFDTSAEMKCISNKLKCERCVNHFPFSLSNSKINGNSQSTEFITRNRTQSVKIASIPRMSLC